MTPESETPIRADLESIVKEIRDLSLAALSLIRFPAPSPVSPTDGRAGRPRKEPVEPADFPFHFCEEELGGLESAAREGVWFSPENALAMAMEIGRLQRQVDAREAALAFLNDELQEAKRPSPSPDVPPQGYELVTVGNPKPDDLLWYGDFKEHVVGEGDQSIIYAEGLHEAGARLYRPVSPSPREPQTATFVQYVVHFDSRPYVELPPEVVTRKVRVTVEEIVEEGSRGE